jgi:RNA polymerase sigma-70 factor (ECF subfamily)
VTQDLNNDEQLVAAAKADLSNFKLLYEKYIKVVFRYSYKRLGNNKEIAEDITSETFVKAIEKFEMYEYRKKPFVAWLYTIAHNLIVDHYRKSKKPKVSLDSLPVPPAEETEEIIDKLSREDLAERINKKTCNLSDELNDIFTLKHTEDLTFAEIAKMVGRTEGAIKMQYYRGLEVLRNLVVR